MSRKFYLVACFLSLALAGLDLLTVAVLVASLKNRKAGRIRERICNDPAR